MVKIGFFSSSKDELKNKYKDNVCDVLSAINCLDNIDKIIYGGGSTGIMGLVHDIFKHMIVSHNLLKWKEFDDENIYPDMLSRQRALLEDADIFIILPGGVGTISEMFDCLMMNDTKSFDKPKPVIVYNCDNFFTELLQFIEKLYKSGASKPSNTLYVATTKEEIINILKSFNHT